MLGLGLGLIVHSELIMTNMYEGIPVPGVTLVQAALPRAVSHEIKLKNRVLST